MFWGSPILGPFPASGFLVSRCFLVMEAPALQGHSLFVKPSAQRSQWGGEKRLVFICRILWLNGHKQVPVPVTGTSIQHSSVSPGSLIS